ncbi:MAG: NADH-quinone oxidoreductase subunit M [Bradymonadales bacterium]|nr:NADH-quinone oxidoreductase subunit M [Bradymonadales bacterium]
MDFPQYATTSHLLTWIIFTPLIGVGLILLSLAIKPIFGWSKVVTDTIARGTGLAATAVVFLLAIVLGVGYADQPGELAFVHHFVWIRQFHIEYFVGVDGLNVALILLTALIGLVAMVASLPWGGRIEEGDHPHFSKRRVPGYMALFLILETGILGTFCALDFFLFYVFWELMLLPMYFLIGVWGAPTRVEGPGWIRGGPYAAIKFFLYTLVGSVLMLLAMIMLYYASGPAVLADGTVSEHTFNILYLAQMGQAGHFASAAPILGMAFSKVIFVGLFIGFAIKVPMFPLHTWLPDAHVDAPTPISVILAGLLLKTGGYGILRFNFQILPDAAHWAAIAVAILGAISIVYAAFVCMAQTDLKKLIAYSSVSHMGFVLLGAASFTDLGMNGAMFVMIAHGIISPMLFLIAGVIYDRAHTRDINSFGGLAVKLPEYAGITGLAFMASLGLPGLAGFVGEIMVFLGAYGATQTIFKVIVGVSAFALVITASYYLWAIHRMFLGQFNQKWSGLWDMNWRERFALYPLAVLTVVLGFYPMPVLDLFRNTLGSMAASIAALNLPGL